MIIELLLNGEYKRGDDNQDSQYEYYYYDYVPQINSLVIVFDTAPESVFKGNRGHIRRRSDQIEQMCNHLCYELKKLGLNQDKISKYTLEDALTNKPKPNIIFYDENDEVDSDLKDYKGKNIVVINSKGLHKIRECQQGHIRDERYNDLHETVALIDLLSMLNLNIPSDFLPEFLKITENKHDHFGFKVEEVGEVKSYTFFVKHDDSKRYQCSERLVKQLSQLLHKKIIQLVGTEISIDENIKLIKDEKGIKVIINELVFNKIQEVNTTFKKESDPTLRNADVGENQIGNAWQAETLLKSRIFDKPSIKYKDKKAHLKLIVDTFKQLKDLDEVIKLYAAVKDHHNQIDIHKHSFMDALLGKSNSASWQEAMRQIREHALLLLDTKLKAQKNDAEAKKKIVEQYNKSPIFTDHRSNNPFRFFYKPKILKSLDLTLEKYSAIIRSAVNNVR